MKTWTILLATALSAAPSFAQDPYAVAPQAYKKQFENDLVRVTRVHYAPHEQLTEHGHPARPTIYVYLKDGGPVLFKHEHGDSGAMAATRPATKAGSYRVALGRNETHIVDNQSDLPSDFLQVEIKTEIDSKTFNGRRFRDQTNAAGNLSKTEFDTPEIGIVRVTRTHVPRAAPALTHAALQIRLEAGDTEWLSAGASPALTSTGEYLLVEFKQSPRVGHP